jgi:predicted DNA-binding protein
MNDKEKTILIRISQEMSEKISHWANVTGMNKSTLVRDAVDYYVNFLSSENQEVLELIKGIIITKIDKVQTEYNDGKMIIFTRITKISSSLSCNLCRDEDDNEYVVYNIFQGKDETMLEAINNYAIKLYSVWRSLHENEKKDFLVDLQMSYVYFSIKTELG